MDSLATKFPIGLELVRFETLGTSRVAPPLGAFGIPMRQHIARGGLCYEPFSGSGSQIMAGEANGRRVFAMEISPAYVDVAVERWQAETGREAILEGDGRTFAEVKVRRLDGTTGNN